MKVRVEKLGVVLEPTIKKFEEKSVFNPGCWQQGEFVHLFYRAQDQENHSTIGYAKLKGPSQLVKRLNKPIITRDYQYESKGVEDPRIVKIDDTFYLTYVAHDGKNAVTALAVSRDLKTFGKKGIITAQLTYKEAEDIFKKANLKMDYLYFAEFYRKEGGQDVLLWGKDVMLFPRKIDSKFAMLHRILPGIQIIFFNEFKDLTTDFWKEHFRNLEKYTILEKEYWFETSHIGGGCPPIETEQGWIMIYHTTEKRKDNKKIYHAAAALLDKDNPLKIIARLKYPLFSPTKEWEKQGFVPNVVFPTGTAVFKDNLYIYYGAADTRIAVAKVKIDALLKELKQSM